jgi:hypothetical protein
MTIFYGLASKLDGRGWKILHQQVEKGWCGHIDKVSMVVEAFITSVVEGSVHIGPFKTYEEAEAQRQPGEGPPQRIQLAVEAYQRDGKWID